MLRVLVTFAALVGLIKADEVSSRGVADTRPAAAASQPVQFRAVDVNVDSGDRPLAAYQFELTAKGADVTIVGVEAGEHAAFAEPPYYDPTALKGGRIIIAAFNTGRDLPTGRTRVATIHLQVTGDQAPEYTATLAAAASADGERIPAAITLVHRKGAAK